MHATIPPFKHIFPALAGLMLTASCNMRHSDLGKENQPLPSLTPKRDTEEAAAAYPSYTRSMDTALRTAVVFVRERADIINQDGLRNHRTKDEILKKRQMLCDSVKEALEKKNMPVIFTYASTVQKHTSIVMSMMAFDAARRESVYLRAASSLDPTCRSYQATRDSGCLYQIKYDN